jgi:hypothetical protein
LAKTCDNEAINTFLIGYLQRINEEIERCHQQLTVQSLPCSLPWSIEELDTLLNEFIGVHQNHFAKRVKRGINEFKASVRDKDRWKELTSCQLTVEQVRSLIEQQSCLSLFILYSCCLALQLQLIERIIACNQEQMQAVQELTKFEQRISCKLLLKSFDDETLTVGEVPLLKEQQN